MEPLEPLKQDAQATVDKDFKELWENLIINKDGSINLEAVKRELSDYRVLMHNASEVYNHITNGKITNTTTMGRDIIVAADDKYSKQLKKETKELEEALVLSNK